MLKGLLFVAMGGGVGAALRHLTSMAALRLLGPTNWPWGTMSANVLGALAMGLLTGWLAFKVDGGRELRLLLATGLLGGFTTFSAFSLETAMMIERKAWVSAALYAGLSVLVCVAAVFVGLAVARRVFG